MISPVSGGGGWGAKQGLLSLDPETSYTAPEQESIDDFIKAFESRQSENPAQGIVTPGSYILFCVAAEAQKNSNSAIQWKISGQFGVSEKQDQVVLPEKSDGGKAGKEVVPLTIFSAMSSEGLYLKLGTPGHTAVAIRSYPFTTKLDVPHSYLNINIL
jgi:hypothetical protein